ncbi:MAG: hypothetical protein ACFFCF_07680 [Promethearchaeota archaeon]
MKSLSFHFLIFFLLIVPFVMYPIWGTPTPAFSQDTTPFSNSIDSTPSPIYPSSPPLPSPDYSGVGAARLVHETANRTDGNQPIFMYYNSSTQTPYNDSASVVLPPGWTGYKLDYSIYNLYENRCWVINPSFDGNSNSWTSGYVDLGGSNTFSQSWQSGGTDGNGFVRVQEDGRWDGSYYRYDNNDRTWWTQTYTVNRSNIAWAAIKMDYYVNSAWGSNALFNVYIRINGTQVWATGFQAVGDTNWHNTGFIEIDAGLFNIPSDAIEVEVGIISTMSVGYSSNNWMQGNFDNIELYLDTRVYPSEINLEMNGLVVQNDASRGSGSITQVPTAVWTTSPVIAQLNWTPTPTPPNPDLEIMVTALCDVNLYANKTAQTLYSQSPTAIGIQFDAESGSNTEWTLYHLLALPTQYWNDVYNFTIPTDWDITFVSEPQLPTVNKVAQCQGGDPGDGYLSIPATTITNSPDGYWTILAESHNYVDSVVLQILDGTWQNIAAVRSGNTSRVRARILDGSNNPPSGVTTTQANVSIYNPDGSTIWYTELVAPDAAGWVTSTQFTIDGATTIGGLYKIVVFWDNSTEAGELESTYSVTHATTLVARESTIYAFFEDQPLYPKVRYNDTDKDVWLSPPATVEGNWTTGTITFNWISGTGYYEAEINALDVPDVGRYTIRVDASKSYYDAAFTYIVVDISSETTVYSPQSPSVSVSWLENATIQVHYMRKTDGAGINGCIPYVDVLANWTAGYYTIWEDGNGWYSIELNSTALPLGTYALNITISKERFQRQQFYLMVTVQARNTQFTYTPPNAVPFEENSTIEVLCLDLDAGGAPILNITGQLHFEVWNGTIKWPSGMDYFWIQDLGGGTYNILVNTAYLPGVGNYNFEIRLRWFGEPYHANRSLSLIVSIRQYSSSINYDALQPIPWDEDANVTIYYHIDDTQSTLHNGDPISGASLTVTLNGTPLVLGVDFTYTEVVAGQYLITIYKSELGTIAKYVLGIAASYPLQPNPADDLYASAFRSITFTVRQLRTRLDYTPPESTPYGDNVIIIVDYLVFDDESSHNSEGINDPSIYIVVQAIGPWPLNPSDYTYTPLGGGSYRITIFASALTSIQTYTISIALEEVTTGHYAPATLSSVNFIVRTVYTALSTDAFDPTPWGINVTIVVHYIVSDASSSQDGNPITGAPIYVSGVGWVIPSSHYSISEPVAGVYWIVINTSAVSDLGVWQLNITVDWPTSPPTYQERYLIANMVVTSRLSSLSPTYIPTTDYGATFNVTLVYYDLSGHGNIANDTFGAHVGILVYNATDGTPLNPIFYYVTALVDDTYRVSIDTSAFGTVNVFHEFVINATWDAGFIPFYGNASANVRVYVVGTKTTVLYTPPEPQPFGDDLIFIIQYNMTEAPYTAIDNTTGYVQINAICTSHPAITLVYNVQMINNGFNGYLLLIDTNNFPELGQFTFLVNVTWPSNIAPYYQSHSVLMSGYVRAIHTTLTWEIFGQLYWGDTLILYATYMDVDHSLVLSDPTNTTVTTWISWTGWSVLQVFPNGTYQIQVPTENEVVGLANFTLEFASNFYETRSTIVQFTINPLPLYVSILSTSPWTTEFAGDVVVTVRILDIYGRRINDSTVTYHWGGFPDAPMTFLGNGIYNASFTANQDVGTWLVSIEAVKTNCQTGIGSVTLYILPTDTILTLLTPTIVTIVGSSFEVSANFSTVDGSPIISATLLYTWAGGNGSLIHIGQGIYNATIDSLGLGLGQFSLYVTASTPNAVERFDVVNVFLEVIPTDLSPTDSLINEYWGTNFTIDVYFNDTFHNSPITGANITFFWGTMIGSMQETGTPGWYTITLPTTIFAAGAIYEVTCASDVPTYEFAICVITVNIIPQTTTLELSAAGMYYEPLNMYTTLNLTGWTVPRSDILFLYFNFTDSNGNPIPDATGSFNWLYASGVLTYNAGLYYAQINMNETSPGLYFIDVTLTRQNYETAQITQLPVTVTLVRTELRGLPTNLQVNTGSAYSFVCTLWDLDHNITISDAVITAYIPDITSESGIELLNLGNGTYALSGIAFPRETTMVAQFTAETGIKYSVATHQINIQVTLHPIVQQALRIGLLAAIIGIIILIAWLAYTRVFAIPWLVRKMHKMSTTLGKGKTPHLSNRDINRISTRPESMETLIEPSYSAIGIAVGATVLPAAITIEEREAEDEIIWNELEKLEGLGHDQKLELFEEMKRIPAKDRIWFLEDLKSQMADGTRFGRLPAEPTPVPEGVDPTVHARLQSLAALGSEEKEAVVEQLRGLSKEEQEEVIKALEETTRQTE